MRIIRTFMVLSNYSDHLFNDGVLPWSLALDMKPLKLTPRGAIITTDSDIRMPLINDCGIRDSESLLIFAMHLDSRMQSSLGFVELITNKN